eukprot:jgi/Mesen1/2383/ME001565S01383
MKFMLGTGEEARGKLQMPDGRMVDLDALLDEVDAGGSEVAGQVAQADPDLERAEEYAANLLASWPQTAASLRKKLEGRELAPRIVEAVVEKMQRLGMQSDELYAEEYARARFRGLAWGPPRIRQELRQRGVEEKWIASAIDKTFNEAFEGLVDGVGDLDCEMPAGVKGMGPGAWKKLLSDARKKWESSSRILPDARTRRLVGWLQRRGFDWSLVSVVLQELKGAP